MLCPNSEFPSSDAGHPGKRDQNSVMFLRKEVFNLDTITFLTDKVWEEFGDAKVGTIHVRFTVLYKGPGRDGALYPTHSTLCLSVSLSHPPLHHPLPPSITHPPTDSPTLFKKVPVAAGDILAISVEDKGGEKFMLVSFHGDTNGILGLGLIVTISSFSFSSMSRHTSRATCCSTECPC